MERLVVITGLSGSGKSLAARCLEDLGFFCVDNLPVGLIPPFQELIPRSRDTIGDVALVIDAREGEFLKQFPETLAALRDKRIPVSLVFLECSDDVLKRRFSESRRPHPMARGSATLDEALADERLALQPLRDTADSIIDTSQFTSHELRAFLKNAFGSPADHEGPKANVVSFGFKYGLPAEADLVFDVRFLPNPYFIDSLRPLDGRTEAVQAFLSRAAETGQFLQRLEDLLDFLIPLYKDEGKSYLTVCIGCTGGKHRSVALAERLGTHLESEGWPHTVSHRDLGKE